VRSLPPAVTRLAVLVLGAALIAACAASTPSANSPTSAISDPVAPGSPTTSGPATSSPPPPHGRVVVPAPRPGPAGTEYYLSLGDSLAQGVEAALGGRSINTPHGYPDQIYAALRRRHPRLQLVKLGCSGETTATMVSGQHCFYPAGSQLAAAAQFLRANAGHVSLVTLDIGANDPGSCFTEPVRTGSPSCTAGPDPATAASLATILRTLRSASASHRVTIVGMSYYVPELPEWRDGRAGRARARASARYGLAFDRMLRGVYAQYGVRVADVAAAYHTADFTGVRAVPRLGRLPRNVAAVCAWTFICDRPPRGPNKHPDTAGYAVIARAFLATLR
jgi:lysophospholipase L1-like esterase